MHKRLRAAANDFTPSGTLLSLTLWTIDDLNRSLEGFDTFAAWKPNPPEERDVDILSALTKNASLPDEAVTHIVSSGWWRVRPRVLFHDSLSMEQVVKALDQLVDEDSSAIWQGASFSVAVETWFYAYCQTPSPAPRDWGFVISKAWRIPRLLGLIATREDIDLSDLEKLSFHPNVMVRQGLLRNASIPDHVRVTAALGA